MVHQNFRYFWSCEFRWGCDAVAEHFANLGAGKNNVVFRCMVLCFSHHDHLVQFLRPGCVVSVEDLDLESAFRYLLFKNSLGIEWTIEIADTGMITTNDQMGCAHVLPEQGMQHSFARSCE